MLPSSKSDIYTMVANECGKSKGLVKFIIQHFELKLKHILRNPLENTKYVMLEWFGTFNLKDKKVISKRKKLEEVKPNSQELDYFNNIIKKYYDKKEA
jgi:nucleoid DNA-binding protein